MHRPGAFASLLTDLYTSFQALSLALRLEFLGVILGMRKTVSGGRVGRDRRPGHPKLPVMFNSMFKTMALSV